LIFKFYADLQNQSNLINELYKLDQDFFPEPWTKSQWDRIAGEKYFLAIGLENGKILTFALFLHSPLEELVHLLKIVTLPTERKKHFARNLLKSISINFEELKIQRCFLEVNCENLPAINLYKSLGFKELNRIPRFYSNGSDAFTMELHLPLNI
jgi:ribosomal-protein-alanine N-acetyltransferase